MSKVSQVLMAKDGPRFSALAQGYWRMPDWQRTPQEHLRFLQQHIELGITTVDHAHCYGFGTPTPVESMFGEVLALQPQLRQKIQIVSKAGIELRSGEDAINFYDSRASTLIESVDTSLRRLRTEYLDVLLIHRPDFLMHADEVAAAFELLNVDGKVQHFGVSNFTPSQFDLLQSRLDKPLVCNQVQINPLSMAVIEDGTLDQAQCLNVRPMAWSCLGGGELFNHDSQGPRELRSVLRSIAEEVRADDIDQILYAWVLAHPSQPVPIVGSGNIQRVERAIQSLKISLSQEQWYRIWVAAKGHPVP